MHDGGSVNSSSDDDHKPNKVQSERHLIDS
jgi:hypothetical protein